jgi:hypothetical protein
LVELDISQLLFMSFYGEPMRIPPDNSFKAIGDGSPEVRIIPSNAVIVEFGTQM